MRCGQSLWIRGQSLFQHPQPHPHPPNPPLQKMNKSAVSVVGNYERSNEIDQLLTPPIFRILPHFRSEEGSVTKIPSRLFIPITLSRWNHKLILQHEMFPQRLHRAFHKVCSQLSINSDDVSMASYSPHAFKVSTGTNGKCKYFALCTELI